MAQALTGGGSFWDTGAGSATQSFGGGALSSLTNFGLSAMQAHQSKKAARKAYERSVDAYKHRYQWAVEDMRAAGLNPILGVQPGSVSAQAAQVPDYSGAADSFLRGASATQTVARGGLERQLLRQQMETQRLQQENLAAQTNKIDADARLADTMGAKAAWEFGLDQAYMAQERQLGLEQRRNRRDLGGYQLSGARRIAEFEAGDFAKYMNYVDRVINSARGAVDVIMPWRASPGSVEHETEETFDTEGSKGYRTRTRTRSPKR